MFATTPIETLYELFRQHPNIATDSRRIVPGSLFFALRGATFDGNRFAQQALTEGAAYAVVDDAAAINAAGKRFREKMLYVENVLAALQKLAALHRRQLGIPILAITGTNGKTTTKELITAVLSRKYRVSSTRGNLNNHIGVPLTLLSMDAATEFGVVEMGASAQGEIALACSIAEPDYGIITNIGRAHLEGFGGTEGVKRGKGELYDRLAACGGTAFVREDDAVLREMAAARPAMHVQFYNTAAAEGYRSTLAGDYNLYNIAAAAAVGTFFGVPPSEIRQGVENYVPDNNRSQRIGTARNHVIADCYNANPSSMRAAIDALSGEPEAQAGKLAILGDMLELGAWSEQEHRSLVALLIRRRLPALLVGPQFAYAYKSLHAAAGELSGASSEREAGKVAGEQVDAPSGTDGRTGDWWVQDAAAEGIYEARPDAWAGTKKGLGTEACGGILPEEEAPLLLFADREALAEWLAAMPPEGKLILVKGSRGMGLETILPLL